MTRKIKPSVRYYARIRGPQGYLRAVIRYGASRKYITTDVWITQSQLARLDTSGSLKVHTQMDKEVNNALHECNAAIWGVVLPLVESGQFAETTSDAIDRAVRIAFRGRKESAQ